MARDSGIEVGFNPGRTVDDGKSRTYYWYAGTVAVKAGCTPKPPAEDCIEETPVEDGATSLVSADLVVQHQKAICTAP